METLKKTMQVIAKRIFTKFGAPFTLATKYKSEKLILSVSSTEDMQFFLTRKNDIATVNFAFDALNKINSILILETGDDSQNAVKVCIDDFAKVFGGEVNAFLISDIEAQKELAKKGGILLDGIGMATAGRTLSEAVVSMEILLKSKLICGLGTPQAYLKNPKFEKFIYKYFYSLKNEKMILKAERKGLSNNFKLALGKESLASVIVYARKMEAEDLTQGTFGNVSVRHGDNFYITPKGFSYNLIGEEDIAKVKISNGIASCNASSDKDLHREIYKAREDIGAIIHTHPIYCSISAASYRPLWVNNKMRHILGNEVKVSNLYDEESVVSALGKGKAVFLGGHGVIVVGPTLQDAYWTLNALEDECYKYWQGGGR